MDSQNPQWHVLKGSIRGALLLVGHEAASHIHSMTRMFATVEETLVFARKPPLHSRGIAKAYFFNSLAISWKAGAES